MSAVELSPEQIHAFAPAAQGVAGDSASPEAIRKLSRQLASPKRAVKAQRKALETLQAALAAIRAGEFELGAKRALDALKTDETNGLAWHVLAICREKSGDLGQALLAYEAALKLLPNETDVAHDLGRLAQQMGYLEIAEKLLLKYLAVDPGHVEATNNLACVLRDQKRYGDAVETLRALLGVEPESPVLWNTLGTVLSDQGDMGTALTFFEEALRHDPSFAKARYNRANARQPLGDALGALEDLEAALPGAASPYERAMMQMARAMLLMSLGRIPEGFEAYEIRLDRHMPEAMRVAVDAPRWNPKTEDIRGKRLLIVGEQGIADEMVFGTCVGDAIEAVGPDGRVYLAVEPRLVGLFQRTFPAAVVGGHKAVKLDGRITRYAPFVEELGDGVDAWIPMASLLAVYRRTLDAFPDRRGYLVPDPDKLAYWKTELEKLGPGLKVGLHWKSLVLAGVRARYFSSFERWRPVLTTPGAVMVNLQCGDVADDLAAAEAAGVSIWTPPIDLKDDLEDVAALSAALDLVIGPGIAGTNLAAAVGGTAWMISAPDDWHYLGTDKYPFYPHLRYFRRDGFTDWEGAIARIGTALEEAVAAGNAR
ncbi:MAG: tetratricopeptide repeat protein [Brevundimonas sp.]|uniref:tetratricopeptide repeat protein n=1 Tax=Brevundimonas sp. TaxID=1871086 RepID=UPI002601A648|nr:tetratricopeptide repeat protein [Brevundimonas sp.]MDI6624033.1 tetratricopeptide repeat protein [Brevundimonas sp.]MDQ7812198.1 tetratricopeptide repeat protein [Brevundimonas sp.]